MKNHALFTGLLSKKDKMAPAEQHARSVDEAKRAEVDESPDAMDMVFKRLTLTRKSSLPNET